MAVDDPQVEILRQAVEHLWSALSEMGYAYGMASGQVKGDLPQAEAFRSRMTEARYALNRLLSDHEREY